MEPVGLIRNVRIHIHGIPYNISLTVIRNKEVNEAYSMLLGRPWLIDVKVTHDWGNKLVTIRGNGTVKTISINERTGPLPKLPEVLVCYHLAEGLTDEEEDRFLQTEEDIFAVGNVTLPENLRVPLPDQADLQQADHRQADFAATDLRADLAPPTLPDPDTATYPDHFYTFSEGEMPIDETPVREKLGEMKVAGWNLTEEEHLRKINDGTEEEPKILKISTQLELALAQAAEDLLQEYTDVFAWTYKDLTGIHPSMAQHRIVLEKDVPPIHQARYRMTPNYASIVKQDIDKLLAAGFIVPVKEATWLSPIVVVPKKNGQLRICIDYRKLNAATKKDPYPLPFTEEVLDAVAGYALYTFLDGRSGYYQSSIALEDRHKTVFITKWGAFVWLVMPFGLTNAPLTYQRAVNKAFKEYLGIFMKLFLDDFTVYSDIPDHLHKLRLCFEKCREYGISLNPEMCIFLVASGILLGHVVSKAGKMPDPKKIQVVQEMPRPRRTADIEIFNGFAHFNCIYIKSYAHIIEPITQLMQKTEEFD